MKRTQDHKYVDKVWGREVWVVNESYCGKILFLNPGFKSSLHKHNVKDETFLVVSGVVMLEYVLTDDHMACVYLLHDESFRIPPGMAHRFRAVDGPAKVVEFSTHHDDEDVVRLEESGNC